MGEESEICSIKSNIDGRQYALKRFNIPPWWLRVRGEIDKVCIEIECLITLDHPMIVGL